MAKPSLVGSVAVLNDISQAAATVPLSFTLDAAAESIAILSNAWDGSGAPVITSVTLVNGGNDPTFTLGIARVNTTNNQTSEIWYLTDSDVDWPAAGTYTINVLYAGQTGSFAVSVAAAGLQDTDPATPITATTSDQNASSTDGTVVIASATDELVLCASAHYDGAADAYTGSQTAINDYVSGGMDGNAFYEDGATSVTTGVTFVGSGAQSWATVAASFQGVGVGDVLTTPTTTSITDTDVTVGASTTDISGTLYAVVVPSADAAPTVQEIKDGQRSGGAAAIGSGSALVTTSPQVLATITTLTASTSYTLYMVQATGAAGDTNIVSAAFSTTAATTQTTFDLVTKANVAVANEVYDYNIYTLWDSTTIQATGTFTTVSGTATITGLSLGIGAYFIKIRKTSANTFVSMFNITVTV